MRIKPGPLSPSDADCINRALERLDQLLSSRSQGKDTEFSNRAGVPVINARIPARCTARITGKETVRDDTLNYDYNDYDDNYDTCRYSWEEVRVDKDTCVATALPGGRKGFIDSSPLVEITGRTDMAAGDIVEAWLATDGQSWLCSAGSGVTSGGLIITVPTCVALLTDDSIPFESG